MNNIGIKKTYLSFFLMFKKKEEIEPKKQMEKMKPIELKTKSNFSEGNADENLESALIEKENQPDESIEQKNFKKMFWVAVKSKRLILYTVILVLTAQGPAMIFTLYRGIGEYYKIEMKTLQLLGSVNFIFECLSGIIIGVLCDYVNLKLLLLIIGFINTALVLTYCLTFSSPPAFFWITNIESFVNGGIFPFNDCYLMKVFGTEIYIELIGYVGFISNLFVVSVSPLAYFIESKLEKKDNAYWILFSIFGFFNFISFVLSFFINAQPFNYEERMGLLNNKIESNSNKPEQEITQD